MNGGFNLGKIEKKWQDFWQKQKLFLANDKSPHKYYCLIEFPFLSGDGLHVGHLRSYTALDIVARKKRMEGRNVLFPIGFDSFGLPTENFAIKAKRKPQDITRENIANFTRQLKSLGFSFDWERVVDTSDPKYYKWTQWIFLKLYEAGLVYQKEMPINWCPSCKIGLANEEVVGGKCERCGAETTKKNQKQWLFKITEYADRLIKDLDKVDFLEKIKKQQIDWIGRSTGAEILFRIKYSELLEKKTKHCLIVHGVSGHRRENWFPWLKNVLQKRGWRVGVPNLPATDHPVVNDWTKALTNSFDDVSTIVCHSLGAPAVLNLIQETNREIDQLIMVAPVNPFQDWKRLIKEFPHADWEAIKKFADLKFDWKKIKQNIKKIVVYYSDDDPYVSPESVDFYKKNIPEANFKLLPRKGHFNERKGITELPELLCELIPSVKIFTTRPDTLYGVTYMVLSPEHELIADCLSLVANRQEVEEYIKKAKAKSDLERTESKEKTGVELKGIKAINPASGEEIPIFVADYVLTGYGTGAIMAVPGHDERDFEFAKKYNLPIIYVVAPHVIDKGNPPVSGKKTVERKTIQAIVYDPRKKLYLTLKWKKYSWRTFVVGGVEENEDLIEAALREIREETGYTDLKLERIMGSPVLAEYYATHKGENRRAFATPILFTLRSDNRVEADGQEKEKIEVEWLPLEKINEQTMRCSELPIWLARLRGEEVYSGEGEIINSGGYNGITTEEFKNRIIKWLEKNNVGNKAVNYKLRDWIFSRQHYWGEPIPLIHCEKCGVVPVSEKDLPVTLPDVENYEPTNTGESPLAKITDWVNVKCPKCGGSAKRETDTMPNWAGSNWYFIRYCDPRNDKEFASEKSIKHWLPVDLYNGGMEHTTLHLLYSRFWYKALYDLKLVPTDEPYQKRVSHGMVLAEDGQKMSKSHGNVINPDAVVKEYGADAVRLYEMFMGPFDQAINWSTDGLRGMKRFLDRIQKHFQTDFGTQDLETKKYALNKTVKKVTEDIDSLHFNTAVSALMKLINIYINLNDSNKEEREIFCKLLSPFAPHLAEELWEKLGHKESIFKEKWPSYDPKLVKDEEVEFIIQVNGKLRERLKLPADILENEAKEKALSSEKVKKYVIGKPKKVIFVKGRLINFVV